MSRRLRSTGIFLALLFPPGLLAACMGDFEEIDIYRHAPDLCTAEADLTTAADECLAQNEDSQATCGGVLSFRGRLEEIETAMTDRRLGSCQFNYTIVVDDEGSHGPLLDTVRFVGTGEYAQFQVSIRDIGADLTGGAIPGGVYRPFAKSGVSNIYFDDGVSATIRISNGKESRELRAVPYLGAVQFYLLSQEHIRGRFLLAFEREADTVAGCFELFPTSEETGIEDFTQ